LLWKDVDTAAVLPTWLLRTQSIADRSAAARSIAGSDQAVDTTYAPGQRYGGALLDVFCLLLLLLLLPLLPLLLWPPGVAPEKLKRTASLSSLDEIIMGRDSDQQQQCFVFMIKVRPPAADWLSERLAVW
jgi:hypothetical protein